MNRIKYISIYMLIILFFQVIFAGCAAVGEGKSAPVVSQSRKIYTSYEIGVNYITHIYTLANAGFEDDEYIKKYGHTISQEDKDFLRQNADKMTFLHNNGGIFTWHLYFIPALNNFQEEREWEDYFQRWDKAIEKRDFSYIEHYCGDFFYEYFSNMFKTTNEKMWEANLSLRSVFRRIGDIYAHNFITYKTEVWPEVQPILKERSEELDKMLVGIPYIEKWEEVTGYQFGNNDYCIVLYYAGANGPSFNNLSLYKNTAFYNKNTEYMIDMFSHELGIHLMMPQISKVRTNSVEKGIPAEVAYQASETLATFYNERVLGRPEKNDSDRHFMEIYTRLIKEGISSPKELYEKGISEYMSDG